ncbi:MAG: hypothetical protein M5U09_13585 [Gammaproteobacteria bacterium]|nr:hypothetical protein [Gammaproteobacteria bacterium]
MLADPKPELRSSMDVISGIEFESGYDPWKGEFGGLPAHLTFHNGIVKFGDDAMLKVGVEGLAGADVAGAALYLAERLFAIFGDEQTIIELDVNRSGLLAFPGAARP